MTRPEWLRHGWQRYHRALADSANSMNIEDLIKKANSLELELSTKDATLSGLRAAISMLVSHDGAVSYAEDNRMSVHFRLLFTYGLVSIEPTTSPTPGVKYYVARIFNFQKA